MAQVQVWLVIEHQNKLVITLAESKIRAHSAAIAHLLDVKSHPNPAIKQVFFDRLASLGAMDFLLARIKSHDRTVLHIKVHDLPLQRVVAIWEASVLLQLQPEQPQIERGLIGEISHRQLTPDEMVTVARVAFQNQHSSRMWDVLVQQLSWDIVHDRYDDKQRKELFAAAAPYQALVEAVTAKKDFLQQKKDERDRNPQRTADKGLLKDKKKKAEENCAELGVQSSSSATQHESSQWGWRNQ